jgi:RNA 3'-terminal phosphate cyclase (ATP)
MCDMVQIDGSRGEGGGQILRTSLTLAALLGREVVIESIRAGRKNPGLAAQHLTGVRALREITGASVEGDEIGSQRLRFSPGAIRAGSYGFDVAAERASAGSVGLVFQTVLPALAFAGADSHVRLSGGTHVEWAPPANFVARTFLPTTFEMGVRAKYTLKQAGYYPKGGGEVEAQVHALSRPLTPIRLTRSEPIREATACAILTDLPSHIAARMFQTCRAELQKAGVRMVEKAERPIGPHEGCVFSVEVGEPLPVCVTAFGRRGKRAEDVALEAAEEFLSILRSNAAVDKHLADQLILPMALADGESEFTTSEITRHLFTNAEVVGEFLDAGIRIEGEPGEPGSVRINGVGFAAG